MASKPLVIEGLDKLLGKVSALPAKLKEEIDFEIGASAKQIERDAKRDAPKNVGFLVNEISSFKNKDLDWEVVSAASYSPFVEFGTRGKVRIPAGLENFAGQYASTKGASSLGAKEAIFEWCKQKGIEPKAWYPIFLSIMIHGIEPHPFFFHNFLKEKPKLIARIKKILTGK